MPQPGDYFVVGNGTAPAALVIEAFTASRYYHAGIFVGDGHIIEAQGRAGVALNTVTAYAGRDMLWSNQKLRDEQRRQVVQMARLCVGIPYSWLDILALGLSAWGFTSPLVEDRLARSDRLICSQLVMKCYRAAGVDLAPGKADYRVTPGDLADVVLGQPVPEDR